MVLGDGGVLTDEVEWKRYEFYGHLFSFSRDPRGYDRHIVVDQRDDGAIRVHPFSSVDAAIEFRDTLPEGRRFETEQPFYCGGPDSGPGISAFEGTLRF